MKHLSDDQLEVARARFNLPEAHGFALAGGSALLTLGAIDRMTRDIDAFVAARPEVPPGDVAPVVAALRTRLTEGGWSVTIDRAFDTFARLVAERSGADVVIDLAVDSPPLFPTTSVDGVPVLAGEDLAARKVLALLDRVEGRDYTDLRALAERYPLDAIIGWARRLDDGVLIADIALAFGRIDRVDDQDLPCPSTEVDALRRWFRERSADLTPDGP